MAYSGGPAGNKIPKGYSAGRLQQYGPEQMDVLRNLSSLVGSGSQLSGQARGDESSFAPFEEQATRDFQNFSGQLGSRFSELAPGAMSARRGSGFQNLATQGAQDFASQLAMQRQQLQRQALSDLLGISSTVLEAQPYKNFFVQKQQKPSFWGRLFGTAAPAVGAGVGGLLGGFPGAMLGGSLGGSFGSGF